MQSGLTWMHDFHGKHNKKRVVMAFYVSGKGYDAKLVSTVIIYLTLVSFNREMQAS